MLTDERLGKYIDFAENNYIGADGSLDINFVNPALIKGGAELLGAIIQRREGKTKSDYEIALREYAGAKPLFGKDKKEAYRRKVAEFTAEWNKQKDSVPVGAGEGMSSTTKTLLIVGGIVVGIGLIIGTIYLVRHSKKGSVKGVKRVKKIK